MLVVTIRNARQQTRFSHGSGSLLLGRRPDARRPHLVIDDDAVLQEHLQLEAVSGSTVRIENLGREDIPLRNAPRLGSGEHREMPVPTQFRIGNTDVEVAAEAATASSPGHGAGAAGATSL